MKKQYKAGFGHASSNYGFYFLAFTRNVFAPENRYIFDQQVERMAENRIGDHLTMINNFMRDVIYEMVVRNEWKNK